MSRRPLVRSPFGVRCDCGCHRLARLRPRRGAGAEWPSNAAALRQGLAEIESKNNMEKESQIPVRIFNQGSQLPTVPYGGLDSRFGVWR